MHGKVGVGAAQGGDEMVLPSGNGSFCCISMMDVGWDELIVDDICFDEGLEFSWSFIVQGAENWLQATGL
jgi:hypothetical protein